MLDLAGVPPDATHLTEHVFLLILMVSNEIWVWHNSPKLQGLEFIVFVVTSVSSSNAGFVNS